jgi:hypothetical protein
VDRHRHHRSATLQGQATDAATSLLADLGAARASTLWVDHDYPATFENPQGARHRLLVALAATHREGPAMLENPRQRAAEELRLGHEAHASAQVHGDEEVIERREVVWRDDRRPASGHELGVERSWPV